MLSREQILDAFQRLSDSLARKDVAGEVCLLGGTAMMIAFQTRQTTKDVDAIFAPAQQVRDSAREVALEMGLEPAWLNDAAKGFVSPRADFVTAPVPVYSNLRILIPTPQYMLAMKVLAARITDQTGRGDKADIRFLIDHLGLGDARQAVEIVARYYDESSLLPRSAYLLDEIFEEKFSPPA